MSFAGTVMLEIEALCGGHLLPPTRQGGASIYRYTPVSPAIAWERQPRNTDYLPPALRAIAPPAALPAPADDYDDDDEY